MSLDERLTDVHQRSARTLLRLQQWQAEANQLAAMMKQANDELIRLDGEERLLLAMKADAEKEATDA